jgi:hypothetical protein
MTLPPIPTGWRKRPGGWIGGESAPLKSASAADQRLHPEG